MFPELVNPVQMAFDTKGRLWVAAWRTYPHWKPTEPMNDKLLILEDTNGDGRADKCKTFAGDLHNPTGFEFWNGGVLVAQGPDLLFLKDTDGDDKYDVKERILTASTRPTRTTRPTASSLDPGGALYFQEGHVPPLAGRNALGTAAPRGQRRPSSATSRARRSSTSTSRYGFANPHGHVFDHWGQDIVVDGTGANPYHAALFSGHVDFPHKHAAPPQVYQQRTRPCPAIEYLSSQHFPAEMQGNLLVGNVIGFQGILRYKVERQGLELHRRPSRSRSSLRPTRTSARRTSRSAPTARSVFTDWHNPIIGHMQHNLRDPSRDHEHGRVYRVTYEGRPLRQAAPIAGEPIDKLLDLLKDPEDRVRYRARIELSGRPERRSDRRGRSLAGRARQERRRATSTTCSKRCGSTSTTTSSTLRCWSAMLASPDFRARAAAARVLCYWRDRVPDALDLLQALAADEHPRVRLEAVRAASFFTVPEAVEVVADRGRAADGRVSSTSSAARR